MCPGMIQSHLQGQPPLPAITNSLLKEQELINPLRESAEGTANGGTMEPIQGEEINSMATFIFT